MVTRFIREQIDAHIAKKVSFKHFTPILRARIKSVRALCLTSHTLLLLNPEVSLYCATIQPMFDMPRWSCYAYRHDEDNLTIGLQPILGKDKTCMDGDEISTVWWNAHSVDRGISEANGKVTSTFSVATRMHQLHGNEVAFIGEDTDGMKMAVRDALSPSQCTVAMLNANGDKSMREVKEIQVIQVGVVSLF